MAKLGVVAVRDRATDAYMNPFIVPSLGVAIRSFQDEVNNPQSPMNLHPDDYDLYHLGEFDQERGSLTSLADGPKQIAIGKNMIKEKA